jgi:hypothetical protein
MKAAVQRRYGPPEVVAICEVGKPAPGDNEVIVEAGRRVHMPHSGRYRGLLVPGGPG